jgi:glucosylceramidase
MCQGALTVDGDNIARNLAYYVIAHASKFVVPGSERIGSTDRDDSSVGLYEDEQMPGVFRTLLNDKVASLPNVAFRRPDGKIVLIVVNDTYDVRQFRIQFRGQYASLNLEPGAVGTYVWN